MKQHYYDLPNQKGFFMESRLGVRVFKHTFGVRLNQNESEFQLEESSVVEDRYIVGIWIPAITWNEGTVVNWQNKELPSVDVVAAMWLTIQEGQTKVLERIWVPHIIQCNQAGYPFRVNVGRAQMAESIIKIGNGVGAADDGKVMPFTFDFLKENRKSK